MTPPAYRPTTPAEERAAIFSDVYFQLGWSRALPSSAIAILSPLVSHGPMTLEELEDWLRPEAGVERGWDAEAWEPLHEWTDDELRTQRESFQDTPFASDPEEPSDAASVMAEEQALRSAHVAELDAQSEALGVAAIRTLRDLLEFMVAGGLLTRQQSGSRTLLKLNAHAPIPGEVLPLSAERQKEEDELRWQRMHESSAQSIIRLFNPHGDRVDALRTSLQRLAGQLDLDVESVRGGVLNLISEGDFSASIDVERAEEHRVFELVADWTAFTASRFSLSVRRPGDEDD
ncbi:DUF6042 family protein [Terrabacter sp. GCM10028922]|uniref:DUF6042 family protein n=1 Tax=Terrabacter sp. GCM10028922 TaxID=3273428 RepID=UPI003616419C